MKKFINRPQDVVEEMLQGLTLLQPNTARVPGYKVLLRADAGRVRDRQVAVIAGGGSGHEPAHAGYIGQGMLSAAVAGEVFTSPSSDSVYAAIRAVTGKPGALLVVKNYTGDRLNFGVAAEMARAEGLAVEMIIVDDDVALRGESVRTGARGLAGTVFIHKIVGAAAEEGKTLTELAAIGKQAIASLATMGVSFSAGTSPAVGKPSFQLDEHEMELGLGIHGEPGVRRAAMQPADQLTETLLAEILRWGNFAARQPVALMVNNLGATTPMELAIVARHAATILAGRQLSLERIYAGTFLSSLDMSGISLSLLGLDEDRLRWLDAVTGAPAWQNGIPQPPQPAQPAASVPAIPKSPESGAHTEAGRNLQRVVEAACRAMLDAEAELTEMDRVAGDGDLGSSMARAARAVMADLASWPLDDLPQTIKVLGHCLRHELGGSSGPLYGVLCLRCATVLASASAVTRQQWSAAIEQGSLAISELGGAHPGDRTMLDALHPFVRSLRQNESLLAAVDAADRGVEATRRMKPVLGRSSYLGDRVLGHADPGARALAICLRAVCASLGPYQ